MIEWKMCSSCITPMISVMLLLENLLLTMNQDCSYNAPLPPPIIITTSTSNILTHKPHLPTTTHHHPHLSPSSRSRPWTSFREYPLLSSSDYISGKKQTKTHSLSASVPPWTHSPTLNLLMLLIINGWSAKNEREDWNQVWNVWWVLDQGLVCVHVSPSSHLLLSRGEREGPKCREGGGERKIHNLIPLKTHPLSDPPGH